VKHQQRNIDEQQREAERQQERRQHGRANDVIDDVRLHEKAERKEGEERDRHGQKRVETKVCEQNVRQVGAEHQKRAVREVDDVHDAPHERKS